jgi:hypothetical protein
MKIGRSHTWRYDRGEWKETKITPDLWQIGYAVTKRRAGRAPEGSGPTQRRPRTARATTKRATGRQRRGTGASAPRYARGATRVRHGGRSKETPAR